VDERASSGGPLKEPEVRTALACFLDEAGRHRLLSRVEERRLAEQIERGDRSARDKLVLANLRLVVALAKRYRIPDGSALAFTDLVQEGTLGLIRAAELFDWRANTRFSTYATFWIRQSIGRALALSGMIRLPRTVHQEIRAIARTERELRDRLGREPTEDEIARQVPISPDKLAEHRMRTRVLRLDAPLDGGATLADLVIGDTDPSAEAEREIAAGTIRQHVAQLPENQRDIIILHYGLAGDRPLSLAKIGRRIGLSRERVRQLESNALTELRRRSRTGTPSRLRTFEPFTWLATLKACLMGTAASAVTSGVIVATATVAPLADWHPSPDLTRPRVAAHQGAPADSSDASRRPEPGDLTPRQRRSRQSTEETARHPSPFHVISIPQAVVVAAQITDESDPTSDNQPDAPLPTTETLPVSSANEPANTSSRPIDEPDPQDDNDPGPPDALAADPPASEGAPPNGSHGKSDQHPTDNGSPPNPGPPPDTGSHSAAGPPPHAGPPTDKGKPGPPAATHPATSQQSEFPEASDHPPTANGSPPELSPPPEAASHTPSGPPPHAGPPTDKADQVRKPASTPKRPRTSRARIG
jgi:RNA polymerase primary sigma factor